MSHLGAVSLLVRDYDEAIAFYVGKLGFELSEDTDMGGAKASPAPVVSTARVTAAGEKARTFRVNAHAPRRPQVNSSSCTLPKMPTRGLLISCATPAPS